MSKPSASHNATEAPVSGGTESAEDQAAKIKLTLDELDFTTFITQHFHTTGTLLSAEKAHEDYAIPPTEFNDFLSRKHVRKTLEDFGLPLDKLELQGTEWRAQALTPRQIITADFLLNMSDQRSDAAKLKHLGVKPREWQNWLADPVFNKYINDRVKRMLGTEAIYRANLALMDRAEAGDVKAIQLLLEYTGEFVPRASGGDVTNVAVFQNIIANVIEIIVDECDGPTANKIGAKIKLLLQAQNMAAELIEAESNTIHTPVIAKARQLSPELKELAARAGGNT